MKRAGHVLSVKRACIFRAGHVFSVKRAGHVFSVKKACIFIQEGMNSESLRVVNLAADSVAHKTRECQ